jgi:hypothetical protein
VAAGAGVAAGAATMTSPSTTTIISTVTRILAAATATTLEAETAHRSNRVAGVEVPIGSTIRNIAAARRIGTEPPRTGSAAQRVETPCPIVKPMHGNRLAGRAAIYPAIAPEEPA